MKKTILVSVGTTLVTMFVVMICMHLCKSHCGQSKCGNASAQCSSSYGHGGAHGKCASYSSKCKGEKSCSSKSKCSKGKSCSSKSKCSKGKSCSKSKCSSTSKDGVTTKTCKYKDGEKVVIKKIVKVEEETEE